MSLIPRRFDRDLAEAAARASTAVGSVVELRWLGVVFTASAAVFAVYFSIHAFALPTVANQYFASGVDQAAVLERAESVLVVLGSIAFTAQAMLGGCVALVGVVLTRSRTLPGWIGWCGVIAGGGWLLGAVLVNFAVIVPFTVLTWVWTACLAVVLWRNAPSVTADCR